MPTWLSYVSLNLQTARVASNSPWMPGSTSRALGRSCDRTNGASRKAYSSGTLRLVRNQLELVGHTAELGKRTGFHLLHRPAAMHLHRGFGDADIEGNLLAQAAARHLNHDFAFPRAERGEALPEVRQSR